MSGKPLALSTLVLLFVLGCTSACSHHVEMERARHLEEQGQPMAALQIYRKQYGATPEYLRGRRAELQFHIGECLLAMNRTREAFSAYNKAVEIDDSNRMAHLRLGQIYLLTGSVDRATEQARIAVKNGKMNIDALSLMGAAAAANGGTAVAKSAFQTVLEKDPSQVKVALSLAELLNAEGDNGGARKVLLNAAAAKPRSSAPWLTLGRLEETLGNVKAAEEDYRKAVKVEDVPETNLRLAQYLERTARVDEAKRILLHVDAIRPSFATAHADFAFIADQGSEAREGYLLALNGLAGSEKANPEDRARTIARLVEADLAGEGRAPDSKARVTPVMLARQHLAYFRKELDSATAQILEAEIALADEDLPTAKVHADAAMQLASESAPAQYISGLIKSRMGDDAGARMAWETGIDYDSSNIPLRLALARLALKDGDLKSAQNYVVPVIRQEPGNFKGLIIFGRVLVAQKEYASAAVIAARAEVISPTSPEPDILRGDIAMASNDPGKALVDYQKAVLRNPQSTEAVEGLARAYKGGNVRRDMLLNMEKIARQAPTSATLLEITGRLFAERGWYDDAKRCLEGSLQTDPTRYSAALQLARVLVQSGDQDQAARYAELVPGLSHVLRGVAAENRGETQAAIDQYEAAVRAGDLTAVAANNLAWLYAEHGVKLDRALNTATRAVELAPHDAGVLDTLGYVYLKRREYSEAVKTLERARSMARLQHAPELPTIEQHLKRAYLSAGQPEFAAHLQARPAIETR